MYVWCLDRVDPEKREEWVIMLNEPLPWQTPEKVTDAAIEMEAEGFMDFMQQHRKNTAGAS